MPKFEGKVVNQDGSIVEIDLVPKLSRQDRRREQKAIKHIERRLKERRKTNVEDSTS